jgi:ABC-type lipoprotein release transport system permease subunit
MTLKHPLDAENWADGLKENLGPGYEAVSWQKLNGPLFSALKKERSSVQLLLSRLALFSI